MSRFMLKLACRFHGDAELIEDARAGDMICSQCGLVVAERLVDVSSEWRTFADDDTGKAAGRVGAAENLLYDHTNLDTMTTFKPKTSVNSRQTFHGQNSNVDRVLRDAHSDIRQFSSRINLAKKVVDRAFLTYKECYQNKYLVGRARDTIIAVCIYFACRHEGSGRSIKEICDIANVNKTEFGRVFSRMKRFVKEAHTLQGVTMNNIIPRFCNQLSLNNERLVIKTAIHIADRANELCDIQGRKPGSIASAAIYLACQATGECKTKKNIKEVTDSSEAVIRDIMKLMTPHLPKLFPSDFGFKRTLEQLSSSL